MIGKRIRKTERVGKRKGTPVEFFHPFSLWPLKNFSSHIFRRGWFGITSPILYLQQILFRGLSLKISAVTGKENPGHLHEDEGSCFCCSDSDADGQLTRSKKVHRELQQNKNYNSKRK